MHVDEQQVLSCSRELWAAQLGLSVGPGSQEPEDARSEKIWSSCVRISGDWQGAILLECPESIVRHAAVVLFAADGATATEDEIHDAVKELADMLGKKMRPLLPESVKLSRPTIIDRDEGDDGVLSGMQGLTEFTMHCEGRPIHIALLESESVPTG